MRIEPATAADLDDLVDAWVDLAATQRRHGSHLEAEANRDAVRPLLAQYVVSGTLLLARRGDPPGPADVLDDGDGRWTDAAVGGTDELVEGPSGAASNAVAGGDPDDVVGFVNFGLEEGGLASDATRGVVHNLYVEPDARGQGVGSTLLDAAEAALAERGADVIAIEALWRNEAARRLYRRRGYDPHRVQFERTTGDESDAKSEPGAGTDSTTGSDTNTRDGN